MEILEFWNRSYVIEPEIPNNFVNSVCLHNKNIFGGSGDWRFKLISRIYGLTLQILQNYLGTRIEYFTPITGYKAIVGREYIGIIDMWFPRECNLFDLTSPILSGWFIEEILEKGGLEKIEEVLRYPSLIDNTINSLINTLTGMTIWGFWLGDQRRCTRKRGIRIREFEIVKVEVLKNINNYSNPLLVILQDKKTKETIEFDYGERYYGWNFYLTKELLANKLQELEVLWTRGYDDKVKKYEEAILRKTRELENLKNERQQYENGIEEFRKKVHDNLWKSF